MRTRVGYAGGSTAYPTYHSLGDHAETVQIDFDPATVTYKSLLDAFWSCHDPFRRSWSRQYAHIVFCHSGEQETLARELKEREESRLGRSITTEIVTYERFFLAEEYHQKHALQRFPEFMGELRSMYTIFRDLVNSTAAARVNGFLGGYGYPEQLEQEIGLYGLSEERSRWLTEIVRSSHRYQCRSGFCA